MRFEVINWLMDTKQSPASLGLSVFFFFFFFLGGGGGQLSGSVSNPF